MLLDVSSLGKAACDRCPSAQVASLQDAQAEMSLDRVEVRIGMQQLVTMLDAAGPGFAASTRSSHHIERPESTLRRRSTCSKAATQDSGSGHAPHWDKLPLREA